MMTVTVEDYLNNISGNIDDQFCEMDNMLESASVLNEGSYAFYEFTMSSIKDKAMKAWKKIVEYFKKVVNYISDVVSGRSENLNMSVSKVNGGDTLVEMYFASKSIFKRTIASTEEVRILIIDKVGEALMKIGKIVDSVAFNESADDASNTKSVFENSFFTEAEDPNQNKEGYEELDKIYQTLRESYKTVKGSDSTEFEAMAKAVNQYCPKLLASVRSVSDKAIKNAKKEPGKKKLRAYKVLKDVVNVCTSFRSYIKDVD